MQPWEATVGFDIGQVTCTRRIIIAVIWTMGDPEELIDFPFPLSPEKYGTTVMAGYPDRGKLNSRHTWPVAPEPRPGWTSSQRRFPFLFFLYTL